MSPRRGRSSRGWLLVAALVTAGILWLTLRPIYLPGGDPTGINWKPLEHHGRALHALLGEHPNREVLIYYLLSDVLGNVVLFVPLGFAVAGAVAGAGRSAAARLAAAAGAGAGLSGAVEALQLLVPGRATDVDDVIFNALGALVGAALLLAGERLHRRGRRPALSSGGPPGRESG